MSMLTVENVNTYYGNIHALKGVNLHIEKGEIVTLRTEVDDNVTREVSGMLVTPYDIPEGCFASYYPE